MKRRAFAICDLRYVILFCLLLLSLPVHGWAQNDVLSTPIETIQPYNPLLPLQQMYCDTRGNTLGTNMEEWQGPSNLRWDDPSRTKTPVTYIDCLGVLHSSSSGGCSSTFTSGCTPSCTAAPANLIVVPGTTATQLFWSSVPGAISYTVSRATALAGPYAVIGTTNGTAYDDAGLTEGTTYYYEVQSNCTQGSSPPSSPVQTTTDPPATPSNLVTGLSIPNRPNAGVQTNQLRLNWNRYASSDATGQVVAYQVQQSTSLSGTYTTIGILPEIGYEYFLATHLTNATPYYYKVAVGFLQYGALPLSTTSTDYLWGSYCAAVSGTPQDVTGVFNYLGTAYADTGTVPSINPGAVLVNFPGLFQNNDNLHTTMNVEAGTGLNSQVVWSGWSTVAFTTISQISLRVGSSYTIYSPPGTIPLATVSYSLDGGTTWTNLRSSNSSWTTVGETHGSIGNDVDLVSLSTSQNLANVQVRAQLYASNGSAALSLWQVDLLIQGTGTWTP
jgi:hypothetical protein